MKVEMEHLIAFDDPLVTALKREPHIYVSVFENAVQLIYQNDIYDENEPDMQPNPKFQVQVHSDENPTLLRNLDSSQISKIVVV